jgi:hypothetical protein
VKVKDYIEMFPITERSDRRKVLQGVVDKMCSEACQLALQRRAQSKSAVHGAFNEVRKQFQQYLEHYGIFNENKLKFFDAMTIPKRNSMVQAKKI